MSSRSSRSSRWARDRIIADPLEAVRRAPDIVFGSWCGKKFSPRAVAARPGWQDVPAVRDGELHEVKSSIILQPGPAALTDGVRELHRVIARWAGRADSLLRCASRVLAAQGSALLARSRERRKPILGGFVPRRPCRGRSRERARSAKPVRRSAHGRVSAAGSRRRGCPVGEAIRGASRRMDAAREPPWKG